MRFLALILCNTLACGLLWTGVAFGQETFASLVQRVDQLIRLLDHSIILTDQDCAIIGDNWKRYEAMDGKMPLAAGGHTDVREEARTFAVGQVGGAYAHQLTVPELPSHAHRYQDLHFDNRRGGPNLGDDDDRDRYFRDPRRDTSSVGGNQPHNNMPPYFVLNFCYNAGKARTP